MGERQRRDREKQGQGKRSREQEAGRGQGLGGATTQREQTKQAAREKEAKKLRDVDGQQKSRLLPPELPQCQAGLCILKASPETPACYSTKARRKAAKLEGSRGPDAGGGLHPGEWQRDEETLPWLTAPTITHPTLT